MARTHYSVMGLGSGASPGEIRRAYLRRARQLHPDVAGGSDAAMAELNAAFAVLSDPDQRQRYDREIGVGRPRPGPEASRESSDAPFADPSGGRGLSAEDLDPRGSDLPVLLRILTKLVPLLFVAAFFVLIFGAVLQVQMVFAAGIAMGVASLALFALMPFFVMAAGSRRR